VSDESRPTDAKRPRVLVVDDEPDDVLIARRELEERFEVEATGSASEALARLQQPVAYDLVVLDYRLGDMNALTFLREAQKTKGGPPVIVVSGLEDPRVAAAARELGAFAFLPKEAFGGGALAATASAAIGLATSASQAARHAESEAHRDVLARMSEGLYAVDEEGVIVLANTAFERLLGYGPNELLGVGVETVMGPDALGATATCLARGEAFVETELLSRSKVAVPALVSPTPLRDPGGHAAVVRDFRTIRDRIGNLERANRTLKDNLVEVAVQVLHNVGNAVASLDVQASDLARELEDDAEALKVILRAGAALAEAPGDERRRELLELVAEAARSLEGACAARTTAVGGIRRAIDHMARTLDTARSFAGRTRGEEPRLDLSRAVETTTALAADIARRAGLPIELESHIPGDAPLLAVPQASFEQLLLNLLKNGIESMESRITRDPGAPARLSLEARLEGEKLLLDVSDTGQGATPEVAGRIFEFGFTTKPDGSGFGLHASAEFVERLGGRISLASSGYDQGATVHVEIPLRGAGDVSSRGRAAA
jgi:PAS domain S-box-containing protein